jgi:hypothetical protein
MGGDVSAFGVTPADAGGCRYREGRGRGARRMNGASPIVLFTRDNMPSTRRQTDEVPARRGHQGGVKRDFKNLPQA